MAVQKEKSGRRETAAGGLSPSTGRQAAGTACSGSTSTSSAAANGSTTIRKSLPQTRGCSAHAPGPAATEDAPEDATCGGSNRTTINTDAGATAAAAAAGSRALYRYLVLPGNESILLREALERRPWWKPLATNPQQGSQMQQQQGWNLWAGLNGQRYTRWELLQPVGPELFPASDNPEEISRHRRLVNRLQEHRVICTKSGLAGVLAAIKAAAGDGGGGGASDGSHVGSGSGSGPGFDISWIPETYVVPAGPKAAAAAAGGGACLSRFKAAFAQHAAAGRRVWIAKPTCLNRGNGIEVFGSLERIMEHLKGRPTGSSLILQKYIERPMLLDGRKFDIRAYVLLGPDGSVWFHKEAYVRTSSTPYDSSDLANRSAHLTNDAVQKHLDTYHTFEDHCKMSLEELGPALRRARPNTTAAAASSSSIATASPPPPPPSLPAAQAAAAPTVVASAADVVASLDTRPGCESGLWGAMRCCVAALFSVAGSQLNPRRLGYCFELLGLDFMLDAEGGLYLIEVNTSPALFRAGTYLADLLPRLVEEVVQKVVDPLFPPPLAPALANVPLLEGFVRVELDEQLAAATAAAAAATAVVAGKTGNGGRAAAGVPGPPPAPGRHRASAAAMLVPTAAAVGSVSRDGVAMSVVNKKNVAARPALKQ